MIGRPDQLDRFARQVEEDNRWTVERVRLLESKLTGTEQREVLAHLEACGWRPGQGLPLWVCGQAFAAKLALRGSESGEAQLDAGVPTDALAGVS